MNFQDYKNIFVYCEFHNGKVIEASLELLGEATRLVAANKNLNHEIYGIVVGKQDENQLKEIAYHGADHVITIESDNIVEYDTVLYTELLKNLIEAEKPDSFLFPATVMGRDLAPRLASKVRTGLTADATKLEFAVKREIPEGEKKTRLDEIVENNPSLLLVTRPAFGGNLFATIMCANNKPQMATVRPGVLLKAERDDSRKLDSKTVTYNIDYTPKTKILRTIKKEMKHADITKAKILISGGRGIGNNFHILRAAADGINAEVSGSRSAVDAGFIDKELQVGQTGKSVKPSIYIANGISGAVQHIAGMEKSDFIIAINTDDKAPIFQVAHLGLVGDALQILPILVEEIRKKKGLE